VNADSKQEPQNQGSPDQEPGNTDPEFLKRVELAAEMEQTLHLYETGLEYC
jgi:hypothetical protein